MPSNPTREELLAQIAALQLRVNRMPATPLPPLTSTPTGTPVQSTLKTTGIPEKTFAVPPGLLLRRVGKATPDEILGQINGIKSLIVSGVDSAAYGDKRTEFRSLTDLRQILSGLEEDLADALGAGGRIRQIRMTTSADKAL